MNKKVIAGIFLAVVAGFFISKSMIQNAIDEGIKNLNQHGLKCTVTKNEGFFTQTREFSLDVVDGAKLRASMLKSISRLADEYKPLAKLLSNKSGEYFDKSVEKLQFKGSLTNSNLNPFGDMDVNLYLSNIKDIGKKPPVLKQILDKKTINFDMIFNTSGELKNMRLKDINDKFEDNQDALNAKIKDFSIDVKPTNGKIVSSLSLKTINFEFFRRDLKREVLGVEKLIYDLDYKNMYDSKAYVSFDKISFKDESKRGDGFSIGKSETSSKIENNNDKFSASADFRAKDLTFQDMHQSMKIKDMFFDAKFKDLDLPTYKKVTALSVKSTIMGFNQAPYSELMKVQNEYIEHIKVLIQKGFKANIDFELKDISFLTHAIKDIELKIDTKVLPNQNNFIGLDALSVLDAKVDLGMKNEDFDTISKLAPKNFVQMAQMYAKKKGNKTVFELILKNGKLTLNSKPLM